MKTPNLRAAARRALALAVSTTLLGLGAVVLAPTASASAPAKWRANWSECGNSVQVSKYISVSTCITRGDPPRGYESLRVSSYLHNTGPTAVKVNLTTSIIRDGKRPVKYRFSHKGVTARKGITNVRTIDVSPCGLRRYAGVVTGRTTISGRTALARI